MKKIIPLITVIFFVTWANAQPVAEKIQMADGLRAHGKIYVVVAVLVTILLGLLLYLIRLDKKISKLEKY